MIKNFSSLLAFFLLTEIALGYWIFIKESKVETGRYDSSIIRGLQKIDRKVFDGAIFNSNIYETDAQAYIDPCQAVNFSTPSMVDASNNGTFEYQLQFHESTLNDIVKNRDKNYIILMLGNSELHGGCCHEGLKISSELQDRLRNHFGTNNLYVVNAGAPGLLLKDEIKVYHEVNDILNPNLVIQHTGTNDAVYFDEISRNAERRNFYYQQAFKKFAKYPKNITLDSPFSAGCFLPKDNREIEKIFQESFLHDLQSFAKNLKKQKVNHIIGIQGYDEKVDIDNSYIPPGHLIKVLQKIKVQDAHFVNFNEFNSQFSWFNLNHTTKESASEISNIYFKEIILHYDNDLSKISEEQ